MNQPDAKWLRAMTREVAEQPVPDVDWDRVETRVFERLEQPGRAIRFEASKPLWPRLAAVAAVAAGVAVGALWLGDSRPLEPSIVAGKAHVVRGEDLGRDGHVAQVGNELVSGEVPVVIQHKDWSRFRLAPHSRVAIVRLDNRVELNLLEGKVEAEVVRRGTADVFSIRVDRMRVSVHGTLFSVARQDDELRVEVQRGSVAVGPAKRYGSTEGWLVTGPSVGTFSLANRTRLSTSAIVSEPISLEASLASTEPSTEKSSTGSDLKTATGARAERLAKAVHQGELAVKAAGDTNQGRPPKSTKDDFGDAVGLPKTLTKQLASPVLSSIRDGVTACYQDARPLQDSGVVVHAHTNIKIRVAPDGHVVFARFDPPLAPTAQACASRLVESARFPRARGESVLTLSLRM
ncbi:MAG: hypothetical protein CSA75_02460 [Sorangium cellulosum]|nr:MAG: hypothetical protein CSA75_02460 [Sorangium cellulosum]